MDILEAAAIELHCVACGAPYEIILRQILISEQMLQEGCPVPIQFTNECPHLVYANMVRRDLILELERIWLLLEDQAPATGQTRFAENLEFGQVPLLHRREVNPRWDQ
jgi:hypothetical protein